MADSSLTLEMLIKEGRAVIGLNRAAEAETKVERGAAAINREAKKAEKAIDDFAKRTTQINATPIEKYRFQMERLMETYRRGKIDQETFTRAVGRARTELHEAGRAQQQTLSSRVLGQIRDYAAGYLGIATAVAAIGGAFQHTRAESEAALSSLKGLQHQRGKFAQIATDMPPGFLGASQARADQAAMHSGADRDKAMQVLFQAYSYGFENQYEEVMGMHPLLDAAHGGVIAGKVRTLTGKKHSPRALANILIEAGKRSPVDAETLSGPMAIALEGGRDIGASAEQTAAVLSVLTNFFAGRGDDAGEGKTGAARVAGDRLRAFGHKVGSRLPKLAGSNPDWIGAFEAVQAMKPGEQAEFFKENEEIKAAYTAWASSAPQVAFEAEKATQAGRATGSGRDNVALGLAALANDPKSVAAINQNRAEIKNQIAKENNLGVNYATASAMQNELNAQAHNSQLNYAQRFGQWSLGGIASLTGDPNATRLASQFGGSLGTILNPFFQSGDIDRYKNFVQAGDRLSTQEQAAGALLDAAHALQAAAASFERAAPGTPGISRAIAREAGVPLN